MPNNKLYANIVPTSKYYAGQAQEDPFEVTLNQKAGEYCWAGNANEYRTADLVFYALNDDGSFTPHGLYQFSNALLSRIASDLEELVKAIQERADSEIEKRANLYELGQLEAMKRIVALHESLPSEPPVCDDCRRRYDICRCGW